MSIQVPRGRIAVLGTSLVQHNHNASAVHIASSARGWASWAEVLSGGQVKVPVYPDPRAVEGWEPLGKLGATRFFGGLNFGVSRQKAAQIENRLDRVLRHDFDLIVVDAGTNDMTTETKEAITETRHRIAQRLLDAGKVVVLLPVLARGTNKWPAGSAERAKANWVNQMGFDFARQHANCLVWDWNAPWIDPDDIAGAPRAGLSNDGVHFSPKGGFAAGKAMAAWFATLLPAAPPRLQSRDDRFDAANNPLGNLVADADRHARGEALTVTVPAGRAAQVLTPRGLTHPGGAWVEASCEIEVPADAGWLGLSLTLIDRGANGMRSTCLAPFADEDGVFMPLPSEAWSGVLRTPAIRLTGGGEPPLLVLETIRTEGHSAAIKLATIEARATPSVRICKS